MSLVQSVIDVATRVARREVAAAGVARAGWGTVTGVPPLTVTLDESSSGAMAVTPVSLVDGLAEGDRVWVEHSIRRAVIVGRAGGPVPNRIIIDGISYQAAGVFSDLPAYTFTASAPVYYTSISVPRPFEAPAGWGFIPHIARTFRYPVVSVENPAASTLILRYVQFATSAIDEQLRIGWRLTPIT